MKQSKQSARRRIVKTKVAKKTFRATVGPFILAERLRLRMPAAKSRIAVFPCGVLCTFWPQKVPKTPRRMPSPTSSRLTFETGARLKGGFKGRWAAERVISDTTLSLLKPASYAGARAFSRAFVSRLRHRAGVVRRETRREGCVRDKQKAQKPTFVPKEGGAGANETAAKDPQVAGLQTTRAAQTPPLKRTLPRAGANETAAKNPQVAGLRRSLPPKDSDTPRARTAECFMYSR